MKFFLKILLMVISIVLVGAQAVDYQGATLRQRWLAGDPVKQVRVPAGASHEEVHKIILQQEPDILYLDAHHSACTEWDIARICKAASELDVPVLMRIDHADQAGLISSMLDLGLFGIKVPTVEDEETIEEIINGFYFPPLGKRSLGGSANYGRELAEKAGVPYYQWWNENAILGCKLETLKGVLHVRYLAKPGIVFFDFGGQDLTHDLMLQKHPGFSTLEDCRKFVEKALQDKEVFF